MKNNTKTGKLVAMLLLVTMILLVLLSGTYAKYTSSVSGESAATVAKWQIFVGKDENKIDITQMNSVEFNLFNTITEANNFDTTEDHVKTGYIAPGTGGKFNLDVTNASDVKAKFSIKLEKIGGPDLPIEYSINNTTWTKNLSELTELRDIELGMTDENKASSKTIYWKWVYENGADEEAKKANDEIDTTIGKNNGGDQFKLKATMTATQLD